MGKILNMTYASSLTHLKEANSSFDAGILKIAYVGGNRNGSYISKESFQNALKSIHNCPIVCNYDRETNTLGGHDVELVSSDDGSVKMVNLTTPVGVIPESAKTWFETVTEEDGTEHEYLFAEALIWKRQEAYKKIKKDGITAQSMEINVIDGQRTDKGYEINRFEFTAFALIGVEPCFESASISMYSKADFKKQFSEMMQEIKESFNLVGAPIGDDNIHPQIFTEGGSEMSDINTGEILEVENNESLEPEVFAEAEQPAVTEVPVEANAEECDAVDEAPSVEPVEEPEEESSADDGEEGEADEEEPAEDFTLASDTFDSLVKKVSELETYVIVRETESDCEIPRYFFWDYDAEEKEVYAWDCKEEYLCGFTYEINGDEIAIMPDSKKRKKVAIVDYIEGDSDGANFSHLVVESKLIAADAKETASAYEQVCKELETLRNFETEVLAERDAKAREEIFSRFDDLEEFEDFQSLKADSSTFSLEELEDKCYSIRGRHSSKPKAFSVDNTPVLKIDTQSKPDAEPYGGLFEKYNIGSKE